MQFKQMFVTAVCILFLLALLHFEMTFVLKEVLHIVKKLITSHDFT